jgi:hypothetical protein
LLTSSLPNALLTASVRGAHRQPDPQHGCGRGIGRQTRHVTFTTITSC